MVRFFLKVALGLGFKILTVKSWLGEAVLEEKITTITWLGVD